MSGTPPHASAAPSPVLVRTPAPARRILTAFVLSIALAAAALAASPAGAQTPAACASVAQTLSVAPVAAVEAGISCLVNAERGARGLAAVEPAAALGVAARRHAADMVARRYFAHVSPSGGTVDKRARRAGYLTVPCWTLGEDLGWAAPGAASAQAVVEAWMHSPKHRAVILDPSFREIGIGIVTRAPAGDGTGATFVLELGARSACGREAPARTASRARVHVS